MSRKREVLTEQFLAESQDGRSFRILVYTTMIDVVSMGDQGTESLEGLKRACTSQGQPCNFVDDDTLEVVELGLRVTRAR